MRPSVFAHLWGSGNGGAYVGHLNFFVVWCVGMVRSLICLCTVVGGKQRHIKGACAAAHACLNDSQRGGPDDRILICIYREGFPLKGNMGRVHERNGGVEHKHPGKRPTPSG